MKYSALILFAFLFCGTITAQNLRDSIQRIADRKAIKTALDSLNCNCDGNSVLYKEGVVAAQGCFHQYRLICGVQPVYDNNGMLIQIKKYKKGKYIGDALLPVYDNNPGPLFNYTDSTGRKQGHWIITGSIKQNPAYKPDATVEEGNYTNSRKTGTWISYWPNGNKKDEGLFVNGRPNGNFDTWYENGHRKEEGIYKRGHWTGDYKLYYENDNLQQHFFFDSLGQRQGKQFYYYPDGKLQLEVEMKNGMEHGWEREYDEQGKLIKEIYFSGTSFKSDSTWVYSEGFSGKRKTLYINGEPTGTWFDYDKTGRQVAEFRNYRIFEGEQWVYDKNGLLIVIKLYKKGQYIADSPLPQDQGK